jgi:hypothetical protein
MEDNILALITIILNYVLKITVVVLGFFTIKLGAKLVSEGAKGEFKFSGDFNKFKAKLESLSPGLFFVLIGCIMIGFSIYSTKTYNKTEKSKVELIDKTEEQKLDSTYLNSDF